jgi:hypothetical protein
MRLLVLGALFGMAACSGNEKDDVLFDFSFPEGKTSYSPQQFISITTEGSTEPELSQVFLDGVEVAFHRTEDSSFEYLIVMPSLEPGNYTLDAIINGALVSKEITSLPLDLGGATPTEYVSDILDILIARLEALLTSDDASVEFRDNIQTTLDDLRAYDTSTLTASEVTDVAALLASNFSAALEEKGEASDGPGNDKFRAFPSFDSASCNASRNAYLFASLQLGLGVSAVAVGTLSTTITGPLGAVAILAGLALVYDAKNAMQEHATGVINNCVANLGDALLVIAAVNKPSGKAASSTVGSSIVLDRFDTLTFGLQRGAGVEQSIRDELQASTSALRTKLLGFKSPSESDDSTESSPDKSFSIDALAQSLINIINSLFEDEIVDRYPSDFTFSIGSVDVTAESGRTSVVLEADIANELEAEEGTLTVTDLTDGHQTVFDVTVNQILPVICIGQASEADECEDTQIDVTLGRDGTIDGQVFGFYNTGFVLVDSSLPGSLTFSQTTGKFGYSAPENTPAGGLPHGYLTVRSVNGKGMSDRSVKILIREFEEYFELSGRWRVIGYYDEEKTDYSQIHTYLFDGDESPRVGKLIHTEERGPDYHRSTAFEPPYQEDEQSFDPHSSSVNFLGFVWYYDPANPSLLPADYYYYNLSR